MKQTPFYHYDLELLDRTLQAIKTAIGSHSNYHVHYAIKANANPMILERICKAGFGVDCVSGGEVDAALKAGFAPEKIVFAGVGKADWEIELALKAGIFCFNVESEPELELLNEMAIAMGKQALIALRVNPNVDAHTHANITTGLAENKFGINLELLPAIVKRAQQMKGIKLDGLHFHVGSQILEMEVFETLSYKINQLLDELSLQGFRPTHINVGGGLGIDYDNPEENPIPDFAGYFDTFTKYLNLGAGQQLHSELGRSVVAQCGRLITKVLYVKKGTVKQFAIVDAGMTDLVRPAMYGSHHKIVNLSSTAAEEKYDVVGPICESSDVFDKDIMLPETHRGDYLALLSAGAYGEIMASQYNLRRLPGSSSTLD